ncbi:MAG: hypothetical protein WC943_05235 [Elusimicrobiota bacterium]|jgi:hypothetical protein
MRLLACLILLLASPSPLLAKEIRLTEQFIDGDAARDQQDIGSCHAYAAVALLETGIYRQHGRKLALSELDLFSRAKVLQPTYYTATQGNLSEGNRVTDDLNLALKEGVATQATVPSDWAKARYKKYRDRDKAVLQALKDQDSQDGWLVTAADYVWNLGGGWAEEQAKPEHRRSAERYLTGDPKVVGLERAKVRELMKDFTVESQEYPDRHAPLIEWFDAATEAGKKLAADPAATLAKIELAADPAWRKDCLARGADALAFIKKQLEARRPVAASLFLHGFKEWGDIGSNGSHAVVIYGMDLVPKNEDQYKEPGTVFFVRNSWGEAGWVFLHDYEACRIYSTASVKVPKDAK